MGKKIDTVRAEETAVVTDAVLEEIGMGASSPPPLRLLKDLIRDVAKEKGIELSEHEVDYIAVANIGWVYRDIEVNPNFGVDGIDISKEKH